MADQPKHCMVLPMRRQEPNVRYKSLIASADVEKQEKIMYKIKTALCSATRGRPCDTTHSHRRVRTQANHSATHHLNNTKAQAASGLSRVFSVKAGHLSVKFFLFFAAFET